MTTNELMINDPLFNRQWHLHNTAQTGGTPGMDLNVLPVWNDYTGRGVRVGVVDDGINYTHRDLNDNYDGSVDFDVAQGIDDATPFHESDNHGTAVAGIIAAEANGEGGVGVAFGATISGIRMDFEVEDMNDQIVNALYRMADFDVVNNSWGEDIPFLDNFLEADYLQHGLALQNAAEEGREGLGTAIVFAAGNARRDGDDSNLHNLTNSRYVISVAALDHTGTHTRYSVPGASNLVSAFGGGSRADTITTTDREGAAGYGEDDYVDRFNGTSAAAPMVSGVVALMLEANPELGYRDIQEILAYSARQVDVGNASWQYNGAGNWNGGGLHTSRDYGFGLVDAHAAVRLAETWTLQSTAHNEWFVRADQGQGVFLDDLSTTESQVTLDQNLTIDRVEVEVRLDHEQLGDLELILVSPDGTESTLMARPGLSEASPYGLGQTSLRFTFGSTQFWGEDAAGTWTLRVRDRAAGDEGILYDWSLRVYGDLPQVDDTYIYTNEFARVGTDPGRNVLRDSLGYDTINAAAVTSDLTINLAPGTVSTIAGNELTIAWGTAIESAIGGDGDDLLSGNGANNSLYGMRGDDVMRGANGDDGLSGWRGDDWLNGGRGDDTLVGGDGRDNFHFSGPSLGTDSIVDFEMGVDKIVLDLNTFSALADGIGNSFVAVANDYEAAYSDGVIIYSQSSGKLFYNSDSYVPGMGDGGQFAALRGTPTLTAQDFRIV